MLTQFMNRTFLIFTTQKKITCMKHLCHICTATLSVGHEVNDGMGICKLVKVRKLL